MEEIIQPVAARFGWTVQTNGKQCELRNRNGLHVATVTNKRNRYQFRNTIGQLLYSAVDLAKGTERVLKDCFFANILEK